MPRKDETDAGVEKQETVKEKEKVAPEESKEAVPEKSSPPWPLITIAAFASVILGAFFIIFSLMVVANHAAQQGSNYGRGGVHGGGGYYHQGDGYGGQGKRFYIDAVRGVITAVDGDTLTVSGGGKQVKVQRTSETVVNGDKEDVAVNDTVVVIGQKGDNGTFTARAIVIRNGTESVNSMPFEEKPQL